MSMAETVEAAKTAARSSVSIFISLVSLVKEPPDGTPRRRVPEQGGCQTTARVNGCSTRSLARLGMEDRSALHHYGAGVPHLGRCVALANERAGRPPAGPFTYSGSTITSSKWAFC